jgi:hypothetical protein
LNLPAPSSEGRFAASIWRSRGDFGQILLALGNHGVLRFPDQHLDLAAQKRVSEQFGESRVRRRWIATRRTRIRRSTSSPT